jgi:hypothetical protein
MAHQPRSSVLGQLSVLGIFALALGCPASMFVDSLIHGPYTNAYMDRHFRLARAANLEGGPDWRVEPTLGRASQVVIEDGTPVVMPLDGGSTVTVPRMRTFYYRPYPWFDGNPALQVHCQEGHVTWLEDFID